MAPTLEALPLRAGGLPTVLLAAGAHTAVFLSEHGDTLDSLELPVRPRSALNLLHPPPVSLPEFSCSCTGL